MTTRSGLYYKQKEADMSEGEERVSEMAQMLRALLEDRQQREKELEEQRQRREGELAEERRLREEEKEAREAELREERRKRDEELAKREDETRKQMELLQKLVEGVQKQGDAAVRKAKEGKDVKVMKLTEEDDIEAYLTTFERLMVAYEVRKDRWAFRLAPQLSGKAQQAYAGMSMADAGDYEKLKTAILRRYDITEESYRQRFRSSRLKTEESVAESLARLDDLATKWMKSCTTRDELKDLVILEQLLTMLPEDVRLFVRERKPKTSVEASKLADDYLLARKENASDIRKEEDKKLQDRRQSPRFSTGRVTGQLARDSRQTTRKTNEDRNKSENSQRPRRDTKNLECFNCHEKGHYSFQCPRNALFCKDKSRNRMVSRTAEINVVKRKGQIEGNPAESILLDTGCSRTMVRRKFVPQSKMLEGEAVPIRCAHGDVVLYPLALVQVAIDGKKMEVKAAVSETLPLDMLLGKDVPEFFDLLNDVSYQEIKTGDALAVVTRAQRRQQSNEEEQLQRKEKESGALASTVQDEEMQWMQTYGDDLFEPGRDKVKQTRSQKREGRRAYAECEAVDKEQDDQQEVERSSSVAMHPLNISAGELKTLQETDTTLEAVRKAVAEKSDGAGGKYFERNGLLFRQWVPQGRESEDMAVEQLVLPLQCRQTVLHLAHDIPFSGHLGKHKTAQRILQRFYWPTLYRDVAEYCRTCEPCQKSSHYKTRRAPLIPMPVIEQPFSRIAMDIIGPLPRSHSGKRYVLVMCDYATRYPEAVAVRSIDAENIAEELVSIFARVGVPREILTDQGSNFTSRLLTELYRLLHIQPIRTSPYHPQTDGLVERFNQTLKSMLRKAAVEEGKDWDKLIPYLLFAYREVPQASTGFSPFELLYGRTVRGPLDILRESWEAEKKSDESVVSHILSIRENIQKMSEIAQENLSSAQNVQKRWYDRTARKRSFAPGDQVLIFLPTTSNKLMAKWQGPYRIVKQIGDVDYLVCMHDRRKKNRVFHVNMLQRWNARAESSLVLASEEIHEDDIPVWRDGEDAVKEISVGENLSQEQCGDLQKVFAEYQDVFQKNPGRTTLIEHRIKTGAAHPVRLPPYRLPQAYRDTVKSELQDMLSAGIIEPSTSEWSAPIVLVKKKDGSLRLCVDYRKLNHISEGDAYPMPRIDELIDRVGGSTYISTLDLTKGYWQVPVAESDRPKTAFSTPFGLYQFNTMPFGLQGAPATFQRLMDCVIQGLEFAASYIDDLIVFSKSWKDHLDHIQAVLDRLRRAGLTAKAKKCNFGASQCVYLGHIVGSGTVKPEVSKTAAIKAFEEPKTKKEVRSFLGITGYYRRFIENYSSIAAPLTDLIKKDKPNAVVWTESCDTAFKQLKRLLCSDPILISPDFDRPFILQTDASDRGLGAVLSQHAEDDQEHPVAYWSRKLLPREQRYSTIEKECLAIKLGVAAFQVYLLGRQFSIETDHRSLVWIERLKHTNNRLARWSLALQPFSFTIRHRAGKANGNADALSRTTN